MSYHHAAHGHTIDHTMHKQDLKLFDEGESGSYGKPHGTCEYDDVYAKKMMFPIEIRIGIIIVAIGFP